MITYETVLASVLANTAILERRKADAEKYGFDSPTPEQTASQIFNNLLYLGVEKNTENFFYVQYRNSGEIVCLNKFTGVAYSLDRKLFDFFDECDDMCYTTGLEQAWLDDYQEVLNNHIEYMGAYNPSPSGDLYLCSTLDDSDYYMPYILTKDEVLHAVETATVSEMAWSECNKSDRNFDQVIRVGIWLQFNFPVRSIFASFIISARFDQESEQVIYQQDPSLLDSWKLKIEAFNDYPDLPLGWHIPSYRYSKDYDAVFGIIHDEEFKPMFTKKMFERIDLNSESYKTNVIDHILASPECCDLPF